MTLATPRVIPVRKKRARSEPKHSYEGKLSLLPVTLSTEARQLAHPSCLAPGRFRDPRVNGWLAFLKK